MIVEQCSVILVAALKKTAARDAGIFFTEIT
jgi:hypothetical protein